MVALDCVPLPSDGRWMGSINTALVVATLSAPLLGPDLVAAPTALLSLLPAIGRALASLLRAIATACEAARVQHQRAFVLAHGAFTYACGDLIAQTISIRGRPSPSCWRPVQMLWAAVIGVLSDTLPFYYWSSLLQSLNAQSPVLRRLELLRHQPALLVPIKIGIHLAAFQPASTAAYLLMQGLRRSGGSLSGALGFFRQTFPTAILLASSSFTVGGAVVYSLPSIVAQAALRNTGVLALCIYLAFLSSAPS